MNMGDFLKMQNEFVFQNFKNKCEVYIVWNWFIAKITLILKSICYDII